MGNASKLPVVARRPPCAREIRRHTSIQPGIGQKAHIWVEMSRVRGRYGVNLGWATPRSSRTVPRRPPAPWNTEFCRIQLKITKNTPMISDGLEMAWEASGRCAGTWAGAWWAKKSVQDVSCPGIELIRGLALVFRRVLACDVAYPGSPCRFVSLGAEGTPARSDSHRTELEFSCCRKMQLKCQGVAAEGSGQR